MRILIAFLITTSAAFGQIGSLASETAIAQIGKQAHPRLGPPTVAYLQSIWTGGSTGQVAVSRIKNAADAFDPTNPPTDTTAHGVFRYLLIAEMDCKLNGNATCQATYLNKIKAMANQNGGYSKLYANATDGVATSNGGACSAGGAVCTVTSATIDFTAACLGSCVGKFLALHGYTFQIISLTGTGQANLGPLGTSNPLPLGSGLSFSLVSAAVNRWIANQNIAYAYDWIYADLDTATRASFLSTLTGYAEQYESNYVASQPTPLGDQYYTRQQSNAIVGALAVGADSPAFMPHLRFELDVFDVTLALWKKVIGNGYCTWENSAGTRTSGVATWPGCGGGWHESWNDYMAGCSSATCLTHTFLPTLLAYANATGRMVLTANGIPEFFDTEGWIKNYALRMVYGARPDYVEMSLGSIGRGVWTGEYSAGTNGMALLGSLDGIAEIYNDPDLRGWARLVNRSTQQATCCLVPDGFEPSAYPFYKPDAGASATATAPNPRINFSLSRLFEGWGKAFMRSGWGEGDCSMAVSYDGNYWSHPEMDIGSFDVYCQGALALGWAGSYRPGSNSFHIKQYKSQAVGHNVVLVCDSADDYPLETFGAGRNDGTTTNTHFFNDCGLRRVGSGFSNLGGQMQSATGAPGDPAQYRRSAAYYNMGSVVGWQYTPKYTFLAIDTTNAYNIPASQGAHTASWNMNQANSSNRTYRVRENKRSILSMPRGSAMYVLIFDHVVSNGNLTKKWLLHTINQPTVGTWDGSRTAYSFTRNELVNEIPFQFSKTWSAMLANCPGGCTANHSPYQQYQYRGKGYGFMTLPAAGVITKLGGPGREFEVQPPGNDPMNMNECLQAQCTSVHGGLTGMTAEPFTVTSSNNVFPISIDNGAYQFVTLTTGARSAQNIVDDINAYFTANSIGALASVEGVDPAATPITQGRVGIMSNNTTPATSIVTVSGKGPISALPSTCAIGQQYFATDSGLTTAQRGYQCTSLNTWTQVSPIPANSAIGLLGMTASGFMGPIPGSTSIGDEGLSSTGMPDMISADNTSSHEVGAWRMEEKEATSNADTIFVNVMLYTTDSDTNLVSTQPATSDITPGTRACPASPNTLNCKETTWKDNGDLCSYRWTVLNSGVWEDIHTSGTCTQGTIN